MLGDFIHQQMKVGIGIARPPVAVLFYLDVEVYIFELVKSTAEIGLHGERDYLLTAPTECEVFQPPFHFANHFSL